MSEAWFVRRFPLGHPRNSMTPAHWKGWLTIAGFSAAMLGAGMAFLLFGLTGAFVAGLVLFIAIAASATYALLWLVHKKGDPTRVIEQKPSPPEGNAPSAEKTAEPTPESPAQ